MTSPIRRVSGIALITDGVAALLKPRVYLRDLKSGTPLVDDVLEFFAQRPDLATKAAALEVVIGFSLLFG